MKKIHLSFPNSEKDNAMRFQKKIPFFLPDEAEFEKRYFGAKGKLPVFGLRKRAGKISIEIVKNCA